MAKSPETKFGKLVGLAGLALLLMSPMEAETNPAASGIEGSAVVSPIHGGPTKMGETDSAPLANTSFRVESATGFSTTFQTDAHGQFKVALPPGRYSVLTQQIGIKSRGCGLNDVEVTAGVFKKIQLNCDSGLR